MNASQIRRGMIILYNGDPHTVMDFQHRTPGNLRAFVQARLRNLRSGNSTEVRFSSTETIERAVLEHHDMEFLYKDDTLFHFMNTENYEQVALNEEALGDSSKYMTPGMQVQIDFFDGQPIGVELPPTIELEVVETEPELRGATASNSPKPAKLENGVVVMVPAFVKQGDRVRINPSEDKYLERAK
jgi:elongation factor P